MEKRSGAIQSPDKTLLKLFNHGISNVQSKNILCNFIKVNRSSIAIKVNNSLDYQTNIDGIYAIGDVNTYPGKLKLILSGFHEAAVMCHSAYSKLNPGKKNILKYTTVSGVEGFDGSKKEAKKSQIKKID